MTNRWHACAVLAALLAAGGCASSGPGPDPAESGRADADDSGPAERASAQATQDTPTAVRASVPGVAPGSGLDSGVDSGVDSGTGGDTSRAASTEPGTGGGPTPSPDGATAAPADAQPPDLWARWRARFAIEDIPAARIEGELQRYSGRQSYFAIVLDRGEPYLRYILGRLEARGLPGELLLVPMVESTFRPFAYSHSRAGGIWQFTPATGRHYGLEQNWWYDGRRDVIASTDAALDYLEYLRDLFDGDWLLALAAYNAGEGRVQRAVRANATRGRPTDFWHLDLPRQTERYVPRILALRAILADPSAHDVELPALGEDAGLAVVSLPGQVDLALAAEMAGISVDELYRYNPGFNRWATPPDGPHRLALPRASAEHFRTALAEQDPDTMVRWQRHRVASGETLSEIAARYNTSVTALQDLNDIGGALIRAGDHLLVPSASRPAEMYALSASNRRRARQAQGPDGRHRIEHAVRPGDTLWDIARAHKVGVRRLASWNGMAPGDLLRPGDRLVLWVEAGTSTAAARHAGPRQRLQRVRYTVRSGDSLYEIAREFGLSVAEIERWNDLDGSEYLQPGQRLELRVDVTEQAEAG